MKFILTPRKSMPLLSAAVLFLFSAAEASAMRVTDISERVKFCFSRTDPGLDRLQSFLKAADSVTYSISGLKTADKASRCSVIVTNTDMKDGFEINTGGDMLRIFLSDDLSRWEKNYTWMTAGMLSKIEMRRTPAMLPGVLFYPGTRGLASGGVRPDLWFIMNNPLEYGDGPSFTLYSETCAVIIDSITKIPKSRDVFMAMLKSAVEDKKPDVAFKTAIDDYIMRSGFVFSTLPVEQISQEKRTEIWFATAIRNSSASIFFPGSSDFVEKRMDELKTFDCMAAAAPAKDNPDKPEPDSRTTEIRSYKIHELGMKWDEIENSERIANIYRGYFIELSNQSSPVIRNDLNKMAELFNNLKDKDREAFADDFKKAETNLREKIVRLRQIEDYIRESETRFVPFGKRYSAELKYIEETGTFTGLFCPSLNSILDKEEKNF
ncbi:MAG: hypothetical protein NT118_05020 [Lentisphaerae bacterium]|nr:hypothetical protein [Lentisphaerota bacterium]